MDKDLLVFLKNNTGNRSLQESVALWEKYEHPEKVVICPRCGEELQYKGYKTAWEVICPTEGCIRCDWRGI